MRMRVFYGWWIVTACMLSALVGNALGLFGAGVYLHQVVTANGWTTGLVSGAVTLFYVVSALLLIPVGIGIKRYGPRPIIASGGIALAGGVVEIGHATLPWEAYLAFLFMGIGWAGLSTTAVATTLAPWFDKHQGRAVSIASLGASAGGIIGGDQVSKGPKDGNTLLMMSNAHAVSAAMYKKLPYDPVNDFQMLSLVGTAGLVMITAPDFLADDVKGTIALLKANPEKYNFGSAGVGTTQQFAAELMNQMAGVKITHVPYRSTPAVIAGPLRDAPRVRSPRPHPAERHRKPVLARTSASVRAHIRR